MASADPRWHRAPARAAATMSKYQVGECSGGSRGSRRGSRGAARHTPTALWLLLAASVILTANRVGAICPSKCVCNDETLEAACVESGLEVVPIQLNPDLKTINLQENRIINVHFTLGFYTNLRTLDVSRNKITTLGSKNFELQNKLINLNLSNNLIGNLSKDTFKGLRNLRVLDLSENLLESLEGGAFFQLPNLRELHVRRNKILDIGNSVFEKLAHLQVLKLDENQLLDIPTASLRHLSRLQNLGLGGNLIEDIPEDATSALASLQSLALDSNVISHINRAAFDGLTSLECLDLSDNNLTTIPTESLSKLNNLTDLDLSGNGFPVLKPVAFQSLFELRRVRLSRLAHLQRIDVRAFVDNIKLESIDMDDNEMLDALPWRLFHGNPLLVAISVRGNGFTSLDASHFPLDQLAALSVAGNPLHCNCSLLWLWLLAQKQADAVLRNDTSVPEVTPQLDIDNIRCAQPEVLRRVLVRNVAESEVRCDVSWLAVIIVTVVVFVLFVATCVVLLLVGNGRCKKEKRTDVLDNQQRLHQNGAVLMLLSQQDSLDNFVLRTNKELVSGLNSEHQQYQPVAQWDTRASDNLRHHHQDPRLQGLYNGQYTLNGSIRKPKHIVYV